MTVELNDTIVHATDARRSARFLADLGRFTKQHYAFLVSDDVFDAAHQRLLSVPYGGGPAAAAKG